MKKTVLILLLTISTLTVSYACDICGCGAGSNYVGILPDFGKKIFGLRYRYNSLLSHVGVGGATTYLTTKESYHITEAWGGFNIGNRFRIMLTVPYAINERTNQGTTTSKNGLGDVSAYGYYQLINHRKSIGNKLLVQSLWIGGGIKLPTGKYNPKDKSTTGENTNLFQLGTASVDYSVNVMYDVRLQDAGLNLAASYKMNGNNKYEYSYGNKLNASAQAYYKVRIKNKLTVAPNAGILYEFAQKDIDNKSEVDISGGRSLLGTAGVELAFKKIAIGGNWQTPFSQNLASGIIKAQNRAMVHISFIL